MEYYNLGTDIIAFTTDRIVGRDRTKLLTTLGRGNDLIYPHQTHSANIFQITDDFLALSPEEQKAQLEGIDAVIYQKNNEKKQASHPHTTSSSPQGGWEGALAISTADCIPVLIYDQEHHAAAAIHAGWKGTVQRIVEKTIAMMQQTYGTNPALCTAAIGPGISLDSFEVGWEVVNQFSDAGFDMQQYVKLYPASEKFLSHTTSTSLQGGREVVAPHIDLKEINRHQLLNCGLESTNIFVSPIDTYTDEHFFSARREQKGDVKCGRILSGFILL